MKEVLETNIKECIKRVYGLDVNGFVIDKPREEELGDLSTNVAFLLSKELKKSPQEVAKELARALTGEKYKADAVRGFINFVFSDEYIKDEFKKLLRSGEDYFVEDLGKGKKIQVEFVSANPTGPLHLGHGRGAVIGDVLANLLKRYGFDVVREYYINDAGYQVYLLGLSILYRYKELFGRKDEKLRETFEREGYKGSYVAELAKDVKTFYGDSLLDAPQEKAIKLLSDYGMKRLLEDIKDTLELIGVKFDVWYSEKSLYEKGLVDEVIRRLREKGCIYEKDGALWFTSTLFGDDKDRVLRRSDGTYTYFADDIAYHWDKFKRGFLKVLNIWGADHHGYLPRLRGALQALGIPKDWLHVEFVQMVRLFSGGQEIRMSKRTGEFLTLKELIEDVGPDAVRFIFLTKRSDTPLDFNLDMLKEKSSENPVFYVQYAHARVRGVFREVLSRYGIDADREALEDYVDLSKETQELKLMKKVVFFKDTLKDATLRSSPHVIIYELIDLVKDFHNYYNHYRVMVEERDLMLSRLSLLKGIETALKFILKLVGVSTPERM